MSEGEMGGMIIPLNQPNGILFDGNGNLYVANFGSNQVLIYTSTPGIGSVTLTQVGFIGENLGINTPTRLALDSAGYLYVTNRDTSIVTIYDVSTPSSPMLLPCSISESVSQPLGIAVTAGGTVYVSNSDANTITKYTPQSGAPTANGGIFYLDQTLPNDGHGTTFQVPAVLAYIDENTIPGISPSLLVGLAPTNLPSVSLYPLALGSKAPSGQLTNGLGCAGNPIGPTGICVDPINQVVYVSSYYNSSVSAYSLAQIEAGGCVAIDDLAATSLGSTRSKIAQPEGVAVDSGGNLYVSNSSANTITVYSANGGIPNLQERPHHIFH